MKKQLLIVLLLAVALIVLSGCSSENSEGPSLYDYKNSYVGDNSAVSAIAHALPDPNGERLSTIELQTKTEPYGITLNYETVQMEKELEQNYAQTAISNAAHIFALVKNAEWVTFNFTQEDVTLTKQDIEAWLGKPLHTFVSELQLTSYMEYYLIDPYKVNQLVK